MQEVRRKGLSIMPGKEEEGGEAEDLCLRGEFLSTAPACNFWGCVDVIERTHTSPDGQGQLLSRVSLCSQKTQGT